jgi:hypothetical protein
VRPTALAFGAALLLTACKPCCAATQTFDPWVLSERTTSSPDSATHGERRDVADADRMALNAPCRRRSP